MTARYPIPKFKNEEPNFQKLADIKRPFTHGEIVRTQSKRADLKHFREILAGPAESRERAISDVLSKSYPNEHDDFQIRLTLNKELADELLVAGRYEDAIKGYKSALEVSMNDREPAFCSREFYNTNYVDALRPRPGFYRMRIFLDLVSCCNKLSQAYTKMDKKREVGFKNIVHVCLGHLFIIGRRYIGFKK